nr:TolC family protein [uncultured Pedobacter sp.]
MIRIRLALSGLLSIGMCYTAFAQHSLSDYIQTAKEKSPLINDNKNKSIANKAEAERLKAMFSKPQLNLNASFLFAPVYSTDGNKNSLQLNPKNVTDYYGYDLSATNGGTYQGLLTITQPLFNGKVVETLADEAYARANINDNAVKLNAHDLEKAVTDQYLLCLQDKRQIDYAKSILYLLNQQTDIVKKLVESSLLKSSDLTLLNIEFENNEALLTTYQANYKRDLLDLNILSGIKDTTIVSLDPVSISLKSGQQFNGFLDKYRLDSLGLMASQKAFETKYKPQLSFFANTGLNAVYVPTIPQRFGFGAGLTLSWNIFDGRQKELNSNKTQALLNSVSFYKENFQTQNELRKAKFLAELESYKGREMHIERQLKSYEDLISAYKKQIITGQLSIIDFVNVLKNQSATERDRVLLQTNKQLLINAYNYWNW